MMKIEILMFAICAAVLFSFMSSAVAPQVIFTSVNLTVNCTGYKMVGEGINAVDSFSGYGPNCTINYFKENIPITFSRVIGENETDMAVLIHSLKLMVNSSDELRRCNNEKINISTNLSNCILDSSFRVNYTICASELMSQKINFESSNSALKQASDKAEKELSSLQQQRMYFIIAICILGFLSWNFWNKTRVKTIKMPGAELPSTTRM